MSKTRGFCFGRISFGQGLQPRTCQNPSLGVQDLGFRGQGVGFRVQDLGFRVQGVGFRV